MCTRTRAITRAVYGRMYDKYKLTGLQYVGPVAVAAWYHCGGDHIQVHISEEYTTIFIHSQACDHLDTKISNSDPRLYEKIDEAMTKQIALLDKLWTCGK